MPPNELAELKIQLQDLLDKGFYYRHILDGPEVGRGARRA
jgi:hypothetical protein